MDWRFNEFPNVGAHALYVTCVEIMTIPMDPAVIGANLVDVILAAHSHIVPTDKLPEWINAVGLILSNLPESYWEGLHIRIAEALSSAPLSGWDLPLTPEQVFDFQEVHNIKTDTKLSYLLAVSHAVWHHAGFNQGGNIYFK